MKKSSKSSRPRKPYPDFPLFKHRNGQWVKKIRGKLHYFGVGADAASRALPRPEGRPTCWANTAASGDGLTLRDLCNRFLTAKKNQKQAGELSLRSWSDYYGACELLIDHFGGNCIVVNLCPEDFDKFRAQLAKTRGPVSLGNAIVRTRIVLKWAFDNELIEKPVRFGTVFKQPNRKARRKARQDRGTKMFEADEVRKLIDTAKQPMKTMILLAVNCGFGQTDVANLPLMSIDFKGGWADFPGRKLGIMRHCPLWPETVQSLRDAIDNHRPEPNDPADSQIVFITKYRKKWLRVREREGKEAVVVDSVQLEFQKLLKAGKLKRPGLGFYALRHVFRTIADNSRDQPAIDHVMGHADERMAAHYRERIDDARLKAVTAVVHTWLFPVSTDAATEPAVLPFKAAAG